MTPKGSFSDGFLYFWKGFQMLTRPGVKRYVITPLVVNFLVFSILIAYGIHSFGIFLTWLDQWVPSWLQWLNFILWFFFVIACFLIAAYTFTLISNLIATPFNGVLSEKIEMMIGNKTAQQISAFSLLKEAPRMLKRQLQFLGYAIICLLVAALLMIAPIIQIPMSLIWFFFSSWMLAVQYVDYPMDNHHIDFHDMRKRMGKQRRMYFGFGVATSITTLIPILNFVVMPAAVIGATLMWLDHEIATTTQ